MRSEVQRWLATIALALGPTAVLATADGPDHYAVRGVGPGHTLSIRAHPNARASKVGAIPHDGNCIRNLGCQGGLTLQEFTKMTPAQRQQRLRANPRWCRVEYRGATGWVAGRFLEEAHCTP
jgi:hypothetical protein